MTASERWWEERAPAIPPGARGLWFGIVELAVDDDLDNGEFVLYVAACPTFDAGDEPADWATDEYLYFPSRRSEYLALAEFGVEVTRDWSADLEKMVTAVRELHPEASVAVEGIAVGYDDGDHELIWVKLPRA